MIIEKLIDIDGCLLALVFNNGIFWLYSIFFADFSFYCPPEIYYTKKAAERVGREAIKTTLGREKLNLLPFFCFFKLVR